MIGVRHLHEDRLFECYVAARSGDDIDGRAELHLLACADCRARYADLSQFMDGLREEAEAETDAIFTPEQLQAQQQQIRRRLEHVGEPARILSFPVRFMRRRFVSTGTRLAPRWLAAAAAGLFVGVGVGVFFDSPAGPAEPLAVARPANPAAPIAVAAQPAAPPTIDDDAFLSELEAALGGALNQELLPFDALTPRVQEISSRPLRY
jgi:predicted anti-sigma-YlaC factor YlaD